MDRISDEERRRIAELLAEGAPVWRLHREINRSRYAIRRAVIALQRPARREPERSPLRLSLAEREEISRGLAAGRSLRGIASGLGRAPSTVCREVAANGGAGRYRACAADRRAVRLAHRPKPAKLARCPRMASAMMPVHVHTSHQACAMMAAPPVVKAAITTATSTQDAGLPCGWPPSGT